MQHNNVSGRPWPVNCQSAKDVRRVVGNHHILTVVRQCPITELGGQQVVVDDESAVAGIMDARQSITQPSLVQPHWHFVIRRHIDQAT